MSKFQVTARFIINTDTADMTQEQAYDLMENWLISLVGVQSEVFNSETDEMAGTFEVDVEDAEKLSLAVEAC